ncbi:unnamed protein product [Paramecium sonneborni]|uniref:Uncharacterized protein n=1 Tax=Paramecium sonneborni TaxID=65129 RepID=A0A8S1NY00_9CILI|nr:unnamed protein product [Paramecium sonneborni]
MQQICDFHLRYIKFICVDNSCNNKLLCDDCSRTSNEHSNHKIVDATAFLQQAETFLKGGNPDFALYGSDLGNKTKIFLSNNGNIRHEIRMNYLRKLEDSIEKYLHQMVDSLQQSKKMIVDFINQSIEDCFSAQVLNNRETGHMIVQTVMSALNAKISTKEANILLYRLHTGDLEREHYEKKIQALVELFHQNVKQLLEPMASQVHKYLKQFHQEMERIRNQIKEEHFQINKINMLPKAFKIKDVTSNPNLQLKVPPTSFTKFQTSQNTQQQIYTLATDYDQEDIEQLSRWKMNKLSKTRKLELLKSLDYTHHTMKTEQSQSIVKQQLPITAPYDPTGTEFKRIIQVNTQHTYLLKIINIQKNVCLTAGKEGTLNVITIEIEQSDLSVVNQHQLKPHQELKDVELCQTPGMFLTTGRNIKILNDKYIDLGFTVKLFLYQDMKQIEQLTEFRDLHQQPIEQLKFINEKYLRQTVEYSKYSNELEFATICVDFIKVWKFCFDSSKIYEGEMLEQYKVELKPSVIKSVDFSDGLTIASEKTTTYLFHDSQLFKQIKNVTGKDQVLRSKLISNHRLLIMTQQGVLTIVDLKKIQLPPLHTNSKDNKQYEPQKINVKKYLRQILFEKEDKELELIDVIQVRKKFFCLLHSSQFDHFLILNEQFELENKYRISPSETRHLKFLEIQTHDLMIAIEGKNDYSIWDVSK